MSSGQAQLDKFIEAMFARGASELRMMADEEPVRLNRLALLNNISSLFLATADISRLQE